MDDTVTAEDRRQTLHGHELIVDHLAASA
jgi:hypothetical protein